MRVSMPRPTFSLALLVVCVAMNQKVNGLEWCPTLETSELTLVATDIVVAVPVKIGEESLAGKWKIKQVLSGESLKVDHEIEIDSLSHYSPKTREGFKEGKRIKPAKGLFFLRPQFRGEPESRLTLVVTGVRIQGLDDHLYFPHQSGNPGGFHLVRAPYSVYYSKGALFEKNWEESIEFIQRTIQWKKKFINSISDDDKSVRVKNAIQWIDGGIANSDHLPKSFSSERTNLYKQARAVVNADGSIEERQRILSIPNKAPRRIKIKSTEPKRKTTDLREIRNSSPERSAN